MDAITALIQYAKKFDLEVRDELTVEDLADIMDCDVEGLPLGITDVAMFCDGHFNNVAAFIQDGELKRFGNQETKHEDPADIFLTTYEELVSLGDPNYHQ